jgi:hypothetical protein
MSGTASFAREVELFDRTLREGDHPVGFLLGAGCSASLKDGAGSEPLVPTVAGLTESVEKSVKGDASSLLARLRATFTEDGLAKANVENWLGRIRSMKDVVGKATVRDFTHAELEALETAVTSAIEDRVDRELPEDGEGFDNLARWAASWDSQRVGPLRFFSLNYDLLLEQALERFAVPFFDGFVGSRFPFLDSRSVEAESLPAEWVRLWKMHGSVNWQLKGGRVTRTTLPTSEGKSLIHPSHLKFEQSRRMPFLLMQDRLKHLLSTPASTLVITGYSFGDDHVNEMIFEGLRANPSASGFAMMHGAMATYQATIKTAERVSNLRFLSPDSLAISGDVLAWESMGIDATSGASPADLCDFTTFGEFLLKQVQR